MPVKNERQWQANLYPYFEPCLFGAARSLKSKHSVYLFICLLLSDSVEIHEDQENDNLQAVNFETGPPVQRSSIVFDIDENDYLVSHVTTVRTEEN